MEVSMRSNGGGLLGVRILTSHLADEVDNWGSGKKPFVPPLNEGGKRVSYTSLGGGSTPRADEVDNWSTAKKPLPSKYPIFGSGFGDSRAFYDSDRWGWSGEGSMQNDQGRRKLILDPPKKDVSIPNGPTRTRPSPFVAARPREEILSEKGVDWRRLDSDINIKKTSRATSSNSSRPSSASSNRVENSAAEVKVEPRQKANLFGDAKP